MILERIGPYRVEERLGIGGMGEVFRAYDERLHRAVAIKLIRSDALDDTDLSHPAIVQIYDVLAWEGRQCLVLELIEGETLASQVRRRPLKLKQALPLFHEIAEALAEAHRQGVIHRDLKTENVMVTRRGHAKVLDFGLAKHLVKIPGEDSSLSSGDSVVGTVRAMSPEQARGAEIDGRSDLFSLGILFYETLTGRSPFQGKTAAETLTRICTFEPTPASEVSSTVPEGFSTLIGQLLAKQADDRPRSAEAVVEALRAFAADPKSTLFFLAGTRSRSTAPELSGRMAGSDTATLKTLLLSDLVGSTHLVERLGDEGAARLFRLHDRTARDLLLEYGGREIDKTDGFLMLFDRPLNAVLYAVAYHQALARLSAEQGQELAARVGIHLGEVYLYENSPDDVARGAKPIEVEGLAKPMAARLMSLAEGRQTLITRGLYDVARRAAVGAGPVAENLRWVAHGAYEIKSVDEPTEILEVGLEDQAPLTPPADSEKVKRVGSGGAASSSFLRGPTAVSPKATRRWIALLAAAAVSLLTIVVYLAFRSPSSDSAAATAKARPAVAVVGFKNVTGEAEADWLGTAVAEVLTSEIGMSGRVRVIAGQEVARAKRVLELEDLNELAPADMGRLRRCLGADFLLGGSYTSVGTLRLDLRLGQLFELVERAGGEIRRHLELEELSASDALRARSALPADPEAARLYSEGLVKLRRHHARDARQLLAAAVEEDREHPMVRFALARAFSALGYKEEARQEARKAANLAEGLPEKERRLVEAFAYEEEGKWEDAIETYESAFRSSPDDLDAGLDLVRAQVRAGRARRALATLEELRRLPRPASEDPRLDLLEAAAHREQGELERARDTARQAVAKGQALEADGVVALAHVEEAAALLDLGENEQALAVARQARELFEGTGDERGLAETLELMAVATYYQGDLTGAKRLFETSLETFRDLGQRDGEARILGSIASLLLDQGETAEAEKLQFEALTIAREIGDKPLQATHLIGIGFKFHVQGELDRALESYQEALDLATEIGDKSRIAVLLTNIAEIRYQRGELADARQLHEEAQALNREIGDRRGEAYDAYRLGKVLAAQGELLVARSELVKAISIQEEMEEAVAAAETKIALASVLLGRGEAGEAERLANEADEVLRSEGMTDVAALAQCVRTRALLALDRPSEARDLAAAARRAADGSEDRLVRLETATVAAQVRAAVDGEAAAAFRDLEKVAAEARDAGFVEQELEARLEAGLIDPARGRLDDVARAAKEKGYGGIAKRAAPPR